MRKPLRWDIIAPVALIAAALLAVAWFDVSTGGEAKPEPLIGAVGTPVRGAYVAPTATPIGARPTAVPRPTFTAGLLKGTPEERDAKRRIDLLLILDAANKLKASDGSYPSSGNKLQTLCVYKELDAGCKLAPLLNGKPPEDPLGNLNGYWYQSDGATATIYAALEQEIAPEQRCATTDKELQKRPNLICVTAS